jgi:hypothetical protein
MADHRDAIISEWADWLTARVSSAAGFPTFVLERELRLLFDVLIETLGPLRRSVNDVWFHACEHFGRVGTARGLAAGEVVEEVHFLRELLIRRIGPVLATLRPRQAMAIILRLNATLDKGIAVAVVGYTDALVATLFTQNGVPAPDTALDLPDITRQLEQIEGELAGVVKHR